MASLFGFPTPDEISSKIKQSQVENDLAYASLSPSPYGSLIAQSRSDGRAIGGAINNLLGRQKVNPQVQLAEQRQQVLQEVAQSGASLKENPMDFMSEVAQRLQQIGDTEGASSVAAKLQEFQKEQAGITKTQVDTTNTLDQIRDRNLPHNVHNVGTDGIRDYETNGERVFEKFNPSTSQWEEVGRTPIDDKADGLVTLVDPNTGTWRSFRKDSPAVDRLTSRGWVEANYSVQAGSTSDLPKSERVKLDAEIANLAESQTIGTSILNDLKSFGSGVTGLSGAVGNWGGGWISQINDDAGENFTRNLTGVSQDQLQAFRSKARAWTVRLIPILTGEEGSRISDRELDIAGREARALDKGASLSQVEAATKNFLSLLRIRQEKARVLSGQNMSIDLESKEGQVAAVKQFMRQYDMTEDEALDLAEDIATLRNFWESSN